MNTQRDTWESSYTIRSRLPVPGSQHHELGIGISRLKHTSAHPKHLSRVPHPNRTLGLSVVTANVLEVPQSSSSRVQVTHISTDVNELAAYLPCCHTIRQSSSVHRQRFACALDATSVGLSLSLPRRSCSHVDRGRPTARSVRSSIPVFCTTHD
jgi:hypothetical protein